MRILFLSVFFLFLFKSNFLFGIEPPKRPSMANVTQPIYPPCKKGAVKHKCSFYYESRTNGSFSNVDYLNGKKNGKGYSGFNAAKGLDFYYSTFYHGEFKDGEYNGNGTYWRGHYGAPADFTLYFKGKFRDGWWCCKGTRIYLDKTHQIRKQEGLFRGYTYIGKASVAKKITTSLTALKSSYESFYFSKIERKKIQSNLSKLGFYVALADGIYGPKTEAAIKKFNKKYFNSSSLMDKDVAQKILIKILFLKESDFKNVPDGNSPKIAQKKNKDIQPPQETTLRVASGSGFYISSDGHIMTNFHVVRGCKKVKAHSKGKSQDATIIATDKVNDLALLKVENKPAFVFPISNTNIFPLQDIIVAGFPFGDAISSSLKFTTGIVSSLSGIGNNYSQIQIDAALQPGNSGGPIVDELGNVIAVAVSKLDLKAILKDFGVVPENTNFGIKSSAVLNFVTANDVPIVSQNSTKITKSQLSKNIMSGTTFLSCWMTRDQIKKLKTKKVMFKEFE